jgi:metal-responsive CopG/Arc/MetJ family transcriptional regulator
MKQTIFALPLLLSVPQALLSSTTPEVSPFAAAMQSFVETLNKKTYENCLVSYETQLKRLVGMPDADRFKVSLDICLTRAFDNRISIEEQTRSALIQHGRNAAYTFMIQYTNHERATKLAESNADNIRAIVGRSSYTGSDIAKFFGHEYQKEIITILQKYYPTEIIPGRPFPR